MTDRPVIFSAPMVRALIVDRKSQTRRMAWRKDKRRPAPEPSPWRNVQRGDRLWVREGWAHDAPDLDTCRRGVESDGAPYGPYYHATASEADRASLIWQNAMFMPRWASRLTLIVTEVRLQRLHDITREDALAEGLAPIGGLWGIAGLPKCAAQTPRGAYAALWDHLHGEGAWGRDPEIVCLSFTVRQGNINDILAREAA